MTEAGHHYTFTAPAGGWPIFDGFRGACVIPARGGSKGIPSKNLVDLMGKPLLAHTLRQALKSTLLSDILVSSDDEKILEIASSYGVTPVKRPPEISGDYSPSEAAVLHALETEVPEWKAYDAIVMLQCTSPIRDPKQIDSCIKMLTKYDSVVSVVKMHQFVWQDDGEGAWSINYNPIAQRPMRQQIKQYIENGSIYACRPSVLMGGTRLGGKIGVYEMPRWTRFEIDNPADLKLVEWIMENALSD